jgi:hypothetical protein
MTNRRAEKLPVRLDNFSRHGVGLAFMTAILITCATGSA